MITDFAKPIENIQNELFEYLKKYKISSLVIGQSGGIDSALCTVLARPVCDKLGIPLISRSITILTNKEEEINRAAKMGEYFTTDFAEVNLSDQFDIFAKTITEDFDTADKNDYDYKIRIGNLKARLRMMYLYDLAAKNKGLVLSTDNYTEYLIGFWTLHGDVGDYGMIQNLWKTEVYAMAKYLCSTIENKDAAVALEACIDAVPTDGLGITSSDLEQIGAANYEEIDTTLINYIKKKIEPKTPAEIKVIERHLRSEYKRKNPFNILRKLITK